MQILFDFSFHDSWQITEKKGRNYFWYLLIKKQLDLHKALFFNDQQQFDEFFPLIWFGYFFWQFSTIFVFFFAGSIPWFHHLLRRYLYLPWHVFRSLRFLEANSFGSRCICSLVILVGMGSYHLFRYVFPSNHLNNAK